MTEFVEVKTAELLPPALDYAVAHATQAWTWAHEWFPTMTLDPTFRGVSDNAPNGHVRLVPNNPMRQESQPFNPSTEWAQGGRLVHERGVSLYCHAPANCWEAFCWGGPHETDGITVEAETPLIAACRAIVASNLGETVSVPKELV